MQQSVRNRFLLVFVLAFPFIVLFGCFIFVTDDLPAWPPLPAQNGYANLVKAGKMVSGDTIDYEKMDQRQLAQLVSQNSAALSMGRAALDNECAVPVQFSTNYIEAHLDQLSDLKKLARAFVAEGELAEMNDRPDDAARSYLEMIRLANASARGGVLIDQLVGTAIEAIGASQLQDMMPQLNAASCRKAASELETLDAQRQTFAQVMQREQGWSYRAFPGFRNDLERIFTRRNTAAVIQATERKFNAQVLKTRQAIIDLAARAYELDKGKPPASATDLVPGYLKAVPLNPVTGMDLSV